MFEKSEFARCQLKGWSEGRRASPAMEIHDAGIGMAPAGFWVQLSAAGLDESVGHSGVH